jgi:cell shape-determining protein MreC
MTGHFNRNMRKLKEEKKMLVTQLLEMEQIIKENEHLRAMLSQVKRE